MGTGTDPTVWRHARTPRRAQPQPSNPMDRRPDRQCTNPSRLRLCMGKLHLSHTARNPSCPNRPPLHKIHRQNQSSRTNQAEPLIRNKRPTKQKPLTPNKQSQNYLTKRRDRTVAPHQGYATRSPHFTGVRQHVGSRSSSEKTSCGRSTAALTLRVAPFAKLIRLTAKASGSVLPTAHLSMLGVGCVARRGASAFLFPLCGLLAFTF